MTAILDIDECRFRVRVGGDCIAQFNEMLGTYGFVRVSAAYAAKIPPLVFEAYREAGYKVWESVEFVHISLPEYVAECVGETSGCVRIH